MKDLREVAYILGMKIYRYRSKRLFKLSQSTYIDTMLKQFSMENFKKDYLLIDHEIFLSKKDCPTTPQESKHRVSYALVVSSIINTMTYTGPNMAYSLGIVCRY